MFNHNSKTAVLVSNSMEFLNTAVNGLKIVVTAIGGGVGIWGVINLLEGYGNDNPGAKSQGMKQFVAGAGIVIIAQTVIPQITTLFASTPATP